jgi:hypothetical protein
MKPRSKILLIIFVLALVSLACNYSLRGPITPEPTIPLLRKRWKTWSRTSRMQQMKRRKPEGST